MKIYAGILFSIYSFMLISILTSDDELAKKHRPYLILKFLVMLPIYVFILSQ